MAKRQTELAGTRRPDEPEPPKPIKVIDDACDAIEKAAGAVTRAGQRLVDAKKAAEALLDEHNRDEYEYETSDGVLKKIFRKKTLGRCKVKVEKKRDDDSDDGEDEN